MSVAPPLLPQGNSTGAIDRLELTVTGEDAGNNLFRERVPVVSLQGRDCTYESRLRVQPGSSLMVEIPPARTGDQTWRAAAIVETVSAMGPGQDLFHVSIVLGRAYESVILTGVTPAPKAPALNPVSEKLEPKTTPVLAPAVPRATAASDVAPAWPAPKRAEATRPVGPPMSESQIRELKTAVASKTEDGQQAPRTATPPQSTTAPARPAMASATLQHAQSAEVDQIAATLRPMTPQMVREEVTSEFERRVRELRESLSEEIKQATQASLAELTQYIKTQPAVNEEITRRTIEEATGQQLVRTTALLQPAVAQMVREAVGAESERQMRELKSMLSREVENAVKDPLAVMAQYTQTLPAIDQETMRHMVGQAAELQFERATTALQPLIAEILRGAVAAEYERQTQQLKGEIFSQVGKAIQGPVALQMAAMLDSALTARMAQFQQQQPPPRPSARSVSGEGTIRELMQQLQAMLDSAGGTMRCVLEPRSSGSNTDGNASVTATESPVLPHKVSDL